MVMVLADDLSVIVSLFPCHMCCWQYHPDLERLEIETGDPGLLCTSALYVVYTRLLGVW